MRRFSRNSVTRYIFLDISAALYRELTKNVENLVKFHLRPELKNGVPCAGYHEEYSIFGRYQLEISRTEFHQNKSVNIQRTGRNSLTPLSKVRMSLSLFSRNFTLMDNFF